MNVDTNKNLLEEVGSGNNAVMITMLDNKKCENKSFQNKTLFTEESLNAYNRISDLDELLYQKAKYALETGIL
ncbi:hypothetical protein G9F72_022655 [Clostridium estertheticum]|uniref:hypothetical protein n=1 Tax=Clostridium estertheticum TaxID=238834 RepID=UPI001CD0873B|nr:hypothetical protein [Clostridium estertheticum]MBZ9689102.1 hypothetical protein [Clostridium estertheticum]